MMTINELENGMLVELRNGGIYRVFDGSLRSTCRRVILEAYTDNMRSIYDPADDIVKVYKADDFLDLNTKHKTLLWSGVDNQSPLDPFDIFNKAVKVYDNDSRIDLAIEEMSELIKALLKYRRMVNGTEAYDADAIADNIAEETADVQIMLDQLCIIFKNNKQVHKHWFSKVDRLRKRIECYLAKCGETDPLRWTNQGVENGTNNV